MAIGGKDRGYVSTIINIDFDIVGKWAEDHRIPYTTFADLSQKTEVAELIKKDVAKVNRTLPELAKVKKFVLLHKEFDPDEAELTRTRKLRRAFTEKRYQDLVDAMYEGREDITVEADVKYRDGRLGKTATTLKVRSVD